MDTCHDTQLQEMFWRINSLSRDTPYLPGMTTLPVPNSRATSPPTPPAVAYLFRGLSVITHTALVSNHGHLRRGLRSIHPDWFASSTFINTHPVSISCDVSLTWGHEDSYVLKARSALKWVSWIASPPPPCRDSGRRRTAPCRIPTDARAADRGRRSV